jgi:hypothetical protein
VITHSTPIRRAAYGGLEEEVYAEKADTWLSAE